MTKHSPLPPKSRARRAEVALGRGPNGQMRYYAFLSYSHEDAELAEWLHRELESFRVPAALAGTLTDNGVVPKRLSPIFRDAHELSASDDLGEEITSALRASQFLIVLCSPDAAKSHWTNAEVELFKRSRPDGCVLAVIAAGEPFASEQPGIEHLECFPPALRQKYDRRGRSTGKRAEPLAADLRGGPEARRLGLLKLIAGLLGVGLDELVQRDATRRHRRLGWLAAASLAGMVGTTSLAVTAIQARDAAREERREAEGLVAFMLGDLKDKLEPIGKLDALDGVGARVLAYYSKQDKADLTDAALMQRSRALSLMGQVAYLRGQMGDAVRLYGEAAAGTGEAAVRNGSDPQRLFDHAQNVFWLAAIAGEQGDLARAERGYAEYKQLALRMVAIAPDNMKWRMEEQYADENLGIVLFKQRRFAEAAAQFEEARRNIEALATADRRNLEYQQSLGMTLAWLADARMSEGKLAEAAALRQRQLTILDTLTQNRSDVNYRTMQVPAEQAYGRLLTMMGKRSEGRAHLATAVHLSKSLIELEPNNSFWLENASQAQLALAEHDLESGKIGDAVAQGASACAIVRGLLKRDPNYQVRQGGLRDCAMLQASLALRAGQAPLAQREAQAALTAAKAVRSSDRSSDRLALAKAQRLMGDAERLNREPTRARAAWATALNALPSLQQRPSELVERIRILQRLGQSADAAQLRTKLAATGYVERSQ